MRYQYQIHRKDIIANSNSNEGVIFYGDWKDLESILILGDNHDSNYELFGRTIENPEKLIRIQSATIKCQCIFHYKHKVTTLIIYSKDIYKGGNCIDEYKNGDKSFYLQSSLSVLKSDAIYKFKTPVYINVQ